MQKKLGGQDARDLLRARTIILACGVAWRRLPLDGFDELVGKGIFYGAARSEAPNTHGLDVHIIGAGNSAGQAAMFFSAHARSVRLTSEDVDDLCAEVFLALLDRDFAVLRQFRGQCSLATYLTVVARRIIVREMARRRMAEALGHVHAHQSAIDMAGSDRRELQRIDDRDELQRMLTGLPDMDAKIVRQYHLEPSRLQHLDRRPSDLRRQVIG